MNLPTIFKTSFSNNEVIKIKEEMPFWLRDLAMFLDSNIPFATSLKESSKDYTIGKYFRNINDVPSVLISIAERLKDDEIKRVMLHILYFYSHGGGVNSLYSLSNDLLNFQKINIKERSSRNAIISLFFMVISLVSPIFLIFLLGIGKFIGIIIDFHTVVLFIFLLFLLEIIILSLVKGKLINYYILVLGILCFLIMFITFPYNFFLIVLLFLTFYFLTKKHYSVLKNNEEINESFIDALYSISSLPNIHIKTLMLELYSSSRGALNKLLKPYISQLKTGISPRKVFRNFISKINNPYIRRSLYILDKTYISGSDLNKKLQEILTSLLIKRELEREAKNIMAIQKYSLLFGALILPVIMKIMISLIFSLSKVFGKVDFDFNTFSIAYLFVYSSLLSTYISEIENKKSKEFIYFVFISIFCIFIFFLVPRG